MPQTVARLFSAHGFDGVTIRRIMGVILTMTMVMVTSMAIVRERENGTLEQLIVTPLKSYELMLGKIIPYVFIGYFQATVALLAGVIVFDLPVRGSLTLLYGPTSFCICVLLSGFMFPRESMPALFYCPGNFLPLTYYLQILHGIVLKGNSHAWGQVLALVVFICATLGLSVKKFKKTLD